MLNHYSTNFRNYPRRPKDIGHVIPITTPRDDEDDWDGCHAPVCLPNLASDDAPEYDENDWGGLGLVTTETPVIVSSAEPQKKGRATTHRPLVLADDEKFRWLIPGIIAGGPHPVCSTFEKDLKVHRDAGFKAIVSICEEPIDMDLIDGFDYYFMPTKDDEVPDLEPVCRHIDEMIRQHKPVYVHCLDGRSLTGTILTAYLIYKEWLDVNEAISYVKQKYSDFAVGTFEQVSALYSLAVNM